MKGKINKEYRNRNETNLGQILGFSCYVFDFGKNYLNREVLGLNGRLMSHKVGVEIHWYNKYKMLCNAWHKYGIKNGISLIFVLIVFP